MAYNVGMIKPSSPTPHHLRKYKLSFIDQLEQPIYTPLIFFYQGENLHRPTCHESLKASLAQVLSQYYPLAGRFSAEKAFTIDCNDSGALFVESEVKKNLWEVIRDPVMEELEKYLPLGRTGSISGNMADASTILLAVKINLFDCGGMAIAVQIHHNLADGTTLVGFMNAWAAASRGENILAPKLDLANLFPPKDTSHFENSFGMLTTEKIVTKRLVFDKKVMEKLKQGSSRVIKDPTRVEAISSFLWRHFVNDARVKGSKKMIGITQAVNWRPRMDPPFPNHAFGNMARPAVALPTTGDDNESDIVGVLRAEIRKVDGDFVKKIQDGGDEYLKYINNIKGMYSKGEIELIMFSSWSRFPLYEVDYGWGRPIWVSTTTIPYKNFVLLMSTSCGEGMEAWINMLENDAASINFDFNK